MSGHSDHKYIMSKKRHDRNMYPLTSLYSAMHKIVFQVARDLHRICVDKIYIENNLYDIF